MRKGFALPYIIFAIFVGSIITIAVIAYFRTSQIRQQQSDRQPTSSSASSNVDETANWKTYSDDNNSFVIRYPPEWEITEDSGNITKIENIGAGLIITITTFSPGAAGPTYCQSFLSTDRSRCEQYGQALIDWGGSSSGIDVYAIIESNNLGLNIGLSANPDIPATFYLSDEIKELFRKILFTFQFLN